MRRLARDAPPPAIDFDATFRRTADMVYAICRAVLRDYDPEIAHDAKMDVFRKLLSHPPADQTGNIDGWLAVAARTTALNYCRAHRRRPVFPIADALDLPDLVPTAEEATMDDETLRERLALLPAAQRTVCDLRLAGLTGDEIAHVLGQTRSWVDTTFYRALQRLRSRPGINIAKQDGTP